MTIFGPLLPAEDPSILLDDPDVDPPLSMN